MNKTTAPFMRQAVMDLEESRIREVANAGIGRPDVLAFWFGESDEVTPDIVRQALQAVPGVQVAQAKGGMCFASKDLSRLTEGVERLKGCLAPD
jgi:hypothetical protein